MRVQLALNVPDLNTAIDFYSKMFATEPNKIEPGYANFAVENPPLKLVLFETADASERINHLGVETFDNDDVVAAGERLTAAELPIRVEEAVTCCYANSNKVWVESPDGISWEWYKVLSDADSMTADPVAEAGCCQ